jgi:pimeloyl-ACP methyl ester carboxylesterase
LGKYCVKDRYRVLAINLFGYGETTPWPSTSPQSLYAQAQLVLALCEEIGTPIHLAGHSFGGSVALKAARLLGSSAASLILLEPPLYLLKQNGRVEVYLKSRSLRDLVKCFGSLGDWAIVAERFADCWLGDGSWNAMPEKRRAAFAEALPPNFHEWDAVMEEETTMSLWLMCRKAVINRQLFVVESESSESKKRYLLQAWADRLILVQSSSLIAQLRPADSMPHFAVLPLNGTERRNDLSHPL